MLGIKFEVKLPVFRNIDSVVKQTIAYGLYRSAFKVRERWITIAQSTLTTSFLPYVHGLTHPKSISSIDVRGETELSVTVGMATKLGKMFEVGFPAFDMKPGLLRYGLRDYRIIGIPIRTPSASSGVAIGVKTVIPPSIYARFKGRYEPGATIHAGAVLPPGVSGEEIFRAKRAYGVYRVFRTVSRNSPPDSWWHPGYRGAKIIQRILPEVRNIVKAEMEKAFRERGLI